MELSRGDGARCEVVVPGCGLGFLAINDSVKIPYDATVVEDCAAYVLSWRVFYAMHEVLAISARHQYKHALSQAPAFSKLSPSQLQVVHNRVPGSGLPL